MEKFRKINHNKWKNLELEYNAEIEKMESKKTDYNLQAYESSPPQVAGYLTAKSKQT